MDIVCLGDTSRLHSKKSADTWTGTAKEKAIKAQLADKARPSKLEIIPFKEFVNRFNLMAEVRQKLAYSRWSDKDVKAKKWHPPGKI